MKSVTLCCACFLVSSTAMAWNSTGHRVVASIAYRQLDKPTRARVAQALRFHPAAVELWRRRPTNSLDEQINLFWNASTFADDARQTPWRRFDKPCDHFASVPIDSDQRHRDARVPKAGNLLASYEEHLRNLHRAYIDPDDRAERLAWIMHQVGDVHQPLNVVVRYSRAFPNGDDGGCLVLLPHSQKSRNLHAHWDDLLGNTTHADAIEALATEIVAEHPRTPLDAERANTTIDAWARESARAAADVDYRGLEIDQNPLPALSPRYEANARALARSRIALAGYRLAEVLKRLFAD